MSTFTVAFSANLYIEVEADDEDAARDKAFPIAEKRAAEFDSMVVVESDWIVIHPDDITSCTKED